MSKKLQILNLPLNPTSHVATDELLSGNYLERNLLVGDSMNSQLDLAKGPLSKRPNYLICADTLLGLLLRCRFNGAVVVAILLSVGARIWRLILSSTVCRWRKGNLQLTIFVCGISVRHHRGGIGGLLFVIVGKPHQRGEALTLLLKNGYLRFKTYA